MTMATSTPVSFFILKESSSHSESKGILPGDAEKQIAAEDCRIRRRAFQERERRNMANNIYATIVGAVQGAFNGEGTGNAANKIPGVAFDYGLTVPTDPASGL